MSAVEQNNKKNLFVFPLSFPKNNYSAIRLRCRGDRDSDPPVRQARNLFEMLLNNNKMDRDWAQFTGFKKSPVHKHPYIIIIIIL